MSFCGGVGAAGPPPPGVLGNGDDVVLVGVVELLKGAVELFDTTVLLPSPPPYYSALVFVTAFGMRDGMYEPPGTVMQMWSPALRLSQRSLMLGFHFNNCTVVIGLVFDPLFEATGQSSRCK